MYIFYNCNTSNSSFTNNKIFIGNYSKELEQWPEIFDKKFVTNYFGYQIDHQYYNNLLILITIGSIIRIVSCIILYLTNRHGTV